MLSEEGPHTYRVVAKPLRSGSGSGSGNAGLERFMQAQRIDLQQRHEQIFNEHALDKLAKGARGLQAPPVRIKKFEIAGGRLQGHYSTPRGTRHIWRQNIFRIPPGERDERTDECDGGDG
ncbi:unnamed protein product [Caenorhabditis angaria]|uniref:Uncharacterized protein n=1 Tax=Caenorhabditis angaria TaxID=860376 RepID=A0A9P1IRV1_9PELO|nr:unnamed protein product [Caenorhabditis angaria]